MKTWSEMTARERDVVVAERVMRLHPFMASGYEVGNDIVPGDIIARIEGGLESLPHYTADHAAVRLVEDEIEKRGAARAIHQGARQTCDLRARVGVGVVSLGHPTCHT